MSTEAIRTALEALKALRLAREQDKYKSWERGIPEFAKAEALADAAIATLTAEMERPAPEPVAWISVDDRLPPRHTDVWCFNRDGEVFRGRICAGMHKPFFTLPRGDGSPSNTAPDWIDVTH